MSETNPWLNVVAGQRELPEPDPRVASWSAIQHLWALMLQGVDEWRSAPAEKKAVYRGRIRGMAISLSMYESFFGVPQGRGRKASVLEKLASNADK